MNQQSLLVPYSSEWKVLYENEESILKKAFGMELIQIEHIGSTSIPDILAKPIIDIAVQISYHGNADKFIEPLEKLGYFYKPDKSSTERHFFQKGDPVKFHLSIAYLDRGGYWNRQIEFRNYLIKHKDARKEYEQLKTSGLKKDEFVQRILLLAGNK